MHLNRRNEIWFEKKKGVDGADPETSDGQVDWMSYVVLETYPVRIFKF